MEKESKNENNKKAIDLSSALVEAENRAVDSHHKKNSLGGFGPSGLVMKLSGGFFKDKRQASYVLIGIVVLAVVVSAFLLIGSNIQSSREIEYNPNTKYRGKELPDDFR